MTPWVRRLIIANVAVFALGYFVPSVPYYLALIPALIPREPWTVITYMFVHAGLWHIFFNMLALYFFGPRLEARLGGTRFLWLYFVSGISGAFLSLLTPNVAIVGASGAVFGVLLGFARYWPRERIYIWAVLPIEARVLVGIFVVLSLLGGLKLAEPGVAHFAHLGGFVGGYAYLKWIERHSAAARFRRRAEPTASGPAKSTDLARWARIRPDDMHPVNRDEYDRIRTKLEREGIASLTPTERAFLDRFAS